MVRPRTKWGEEEAQTAIILHKVVISPNERLLWLNKTFNNKRNLSGFRHVWEHARSPGDANYPCWIRWESETVHTAVLKLQELLREPHVILEGGVLWYMEELATIAEMNRSGWKTDTIQNLLKIQFGHDRNVAAHIWRMTNPTDPKTHVHPGGRPRMARQRTQLDAVDEEHIANAEDHQELLPDNTLYTGPSDPVSLAYANQSAIITPFVPNYITDY
ncbi:MAG: hypothetical protein Q9218_006585, partial [Villophora microphyllina]